MYVCKQYIVRCMEGWPSPTLCASCDGENKKKKKKKKGFAQSLSDHEEVRFNDTSTHEGHLCQDGKLT